MTHADRDASEPRNANTGHGHVRPRPDGVRARCGGPGLCSQCSREAALGAPQAAQERGDERWADWHNAMLIVGLGRTPQDALPRYVTEALRLADAEQAELRAEVERLNERVRYWRYSETASLRRALDDAERALADERAGWRKVTSALGYGDGITEPQIGHAEFVTEMEQQARDANEWRDHQLWMNDCAAAGHDELEDCYLHDPHRIAEANAAKVARVEALMDRWGQEGIERGPDDMVYTSGVAAMIRAALGGS